MPFQPELGIRHHHDGMVGAASLRPNPEMLYLGIKDPRFYGNAVNFESYLFYTARDKQELQLTEALSIIGKYTRLSTAQVTRLRRKAPDILGLEKVGVSGYRIQRSQVRSLYLVGYGVQEVSKKMIHETHIDWKDVEEFLEDNVGGHLLMSAIDFHRPVASEKSKEEA